MMCNRFIMIFQLIIGSNVLVFLSGYLFLPSRLYNRCLGDFKPWSLLGSAVIPYSGLHTLLHFLFPRRDFLLMPFFFDINLCRPTLLDFPIGRRTTSVKTSSSSRLVFKSTWLRAWWSGELILKWLSCSDFIDKSPLSMMSSLKGKGMISILYFHMP